MKNASGMNYDQFSLTILHFAPFYLASSRTFSPPTQEMMRESLPDLLLHVFSCPSRSDISLSTYTLM